MITREKLEAIRAQLKLTQLEMAAYMDCDYLSYKRYATGARSIPRYIARSAQMIDFINSKGLTEEMTQYIKDQAPYSIHARLQPLPLKANGLPITISWLRSADEAGFLAPPVEALLTCDSDSGMFEVYSSDKEKLLLKMKDPRQSMNSPYLGYMTVCGLETQLIGGVEKEVVTSVAIWSKK